ncbi:hypothetical protein [Pedobacter sp. MW01-1-1]|uniref:hypothetical protein n=1 Tax=Pedobacter sp. MW01-1-1 TaxID=3383027 RepID=UPI003FEECB09
MNLSKIPFTVNRNLLLLTFLLISSSTFACDICGCFMGITPYSNRNGISVLYRYRSFNGYSGQKHNLFPEGGKFFIPARNQDAPLTQHNGDPTDFEINRALEIRGKYFVTNKIELNAILPYISNSEQYNGYLTTVNGLGDINFYAGYHVFQKYESRFKQQLIVGAGVKFASGRNDLKNNEGILYSNLVQAGTGSTDGYVYANYMVGLGKFGASLNASYKVNGTNNRDESIANSTSNYLNVFYKQMLGKNWQVIPSAQFFYEYTAGETYKGQKTGEHEMNNFMGGLGLDIFYKNVGLNTGIQKNIWEGKTDHPMSAGKIFVGVSYNF